MYHFILVVCGNNVSVVHRFRDITTSTVYVTACDLEKALIFDTTVEITGHVRFPIHALYKYIVNRCVLYFARYRSQKGFKQLKRSSRSLKVIIIIGASR